MNDFCEEMIMLQNACGAKATTLATKYGILDTEPPLNALNVAFNTSTLVGELSLFYFEALKNEVQKKGHINETISNEMFQRLIFLGKTALIHIVSAFENAMKETNSLHDNPLLLKEKRIYLADVIVQSEKLGLVDGEARALWMGVNSIRNWMIHNNGVAQCDCEWTFQTGTTFKGWKNQMTYGHYTSFPKICRWTVDAYASWCENFLIKFKS